MDKLKDYKKHTVFFDFDNTITTKDVLDDMLLRFSKDDRWMELEKMWKNKEIGSLECLKGQVEGLRIKKETLDEYLSGVEIDPYFKKLIKLLNSNKVRVIILSDNFDYILDNVLKNHDITGLEVYSNRLRLVGDRLIPSFPYRNEKCGDCAHCKNTTMSQNVENGGTSVYIGDGLSDVCASKDADLIFAKDYLKEHLAGAHIDYVAFDNLKDIYEYFRRSLS